MNERQLAGSIGGHESWARTPDRTARTAPGRAKFEERFYRDVPADLPEHVRDQMAQSARQAYFKRLARASVQARRKSTAGDAA
jgi:hypothetical protein